MKKLFTYNLLARILFLILTPMFFRVLNFAFIWHSIYWGVVTWVVVIWGSLVLLSPLIGRIGCGWLCFIGTLQDFPGQQAVFKIPWSKPKWWIRAQVILAFFGTSLIFLFLNLQSGTVTHVQFDLGFFGVDFYDHYKHVWLYDAVGAVLFGFLLDKRWICRNLCFMGSLCSAGASLSRLIPVVDKEKCNECGRCDRDCLVKIPITQYVAVNGGLVTDPECLVCGRCIDSCRTKAISIKFVWNRKKYRRNKSAMITSGRHYGSGDHP
jgi:ferredoxin-type protein NapH